MPSLTGRFSYYSAHMGYDLIACATGTFYLIFSSRVQGTLCVAFPLAPISYGVEFSWLQQHVEIHKARPGERPALLRGRVYRQSVRLHPHPSPL
jgi:hypothetical protein